jgi:hypothetical protein
LARRRTYPIQILGTEDQGSGTWLWAWANSQSGFPPGLLKAAERVRSFGESEGVAELVTAMLPSSEYPGHLLACVAAGIADADCYFPGAIPGGACFMLIFETPLRQASPTDPVRIIRVLTQVTCAFGVDHRAMARAYLEAEGLRIVDKGVPGTAGVCAMGRIAHHGHCSPRRARLRRGPFPPGLPSLSGLSGRRSHPPMGSARAGSLGPAGTPLAISPAQTRR